MFVTDKDLECFDLKQSRPNFLLKKYKYNVIKYFIKHINYGNAILAHDNFTVITKTVVTRIFGRKL